MTIALDPAFPTQWGHPGITKREWIATQIQSALVQSWGLEIGLHRTDATFAADAVRLADNLIVELSKSD